MLTNKVLQIIISCLLVLGVLLCVYTPENLLLKWGTNFTPQIMFAYLVLSLGFLLVSQQRLMMTSFACCAVLCLFLKEASGDVLKHPESNGQASISIAHFNLANSETNPQKQFQAMLNTKADLLSIQELTPDWEMPLVQMLQMDYPHFKSIPDLGTNGVAIYSKYPFKTIDTFHYDHIPNIIGSVVLKEHDFHFIASHTKPAFTESAYLAQQAHLETVAHKCRAIRDPLVTFGEYHATPWSEEIRQFRRQARLNDSRRNLTPSYPHGTMSFFDVPIDHIFFTDHFQCTDFRTISGETSKHLGIQAVFEFVDPTLDVLTEARKKYYVRETSLSF
ncbi:MAG: endonuclease/exonuclease/phosphatase family protein [Bacteroidota bacterium]